MSSNKIRKPELSIIQKLIIKIRYGLVLNTIRTTLIKIGIEFSPYYLFREGLDVPEIPEIQGMASKYKIELLGSKDIEKIGTPDSVFTEKEIRSSIEQGGKCIGVKDGEDLVALMLLNFDGISYKSTAAIKLKNNEAYLWSMYTSVPYRGRNIAPYLRIRSYDLLQAMGRDVLYSISDYFNSPAIRFKEKLNAKKLKLILFIQLFNKFKWSFTLKTY